MAKKRKNETKEIPQVVQPVEVEQPKWLQMVYRLTIMVIGMLAITVIGTVLMSDFVKKDPTNIWPSLTIMAGWAVWIVYVFKFMSIKRTEKKSGFLGLFSKKPQD